MPSASPRAESVTEPDTRTALLNTLRQLHKAGKESNDLLKSTYRHRSDFALSSLCYVLSECMYYLHPGTFTPYRISWGDGTTHWFLRLSNDDIFDAIAPDGAECYTPEDYESARRLSFFTRQPSKRARLLMERAGLELPNTDK